MKKISVLVVSVAAIGLLGWKFFVASPAGAEHLKAEIQADAAKPVLSDSASVLKAVSAVAPASAISATAAVEPSSTQSAVALVKAAGGRFYEIDGEVSITTTKNAAHRATKSDTIISGTVINAGDNGHAVLIFDDDQIVYMQPNSTFEVHDYSYDPKQAWNNKIDFAISQGGLRFITGKIGQQNHKAFKLTTPSGTVDIRGTEFSVVVDKDKKSVYTDVVSGGIGMTNTAGTTVSAAGQSALTASANVLTAVIPAASVPANTFKSLDTLAGKSGVKGIVKKSGVKGVATKSGVKGAIAQAAQKSPAVSITAATGLAAPAAETAAATSIVVAEAAPAGGVDAVPPVVSTTVASEATSPATAAAANSGDTVFVAAPAVVSGFYVGAQLGSVNYRYSNITHNGQIGFGLLGGYAINENFAVEAEYNSLGGFDSVKSTLKGRSIGVSGVGYYALNPQFTLFGKLGIASTSLKETAKPGFIGSATYSDTGLAVGIGAQYNVNPRVGIRIGVNLNSVGDAVSSKSTASLLYVGGVCKF